MNKDMKEIPTYSVLPVGYEWSLTKSLRFERDSTRTKVGHINSRERLARPTLGDFGYPLKNVKNGKVRVLKETHYLEEAKITHEIFNVKHYTNWKIGRIWKKSSSVDFVFPLDKEVLDSLNRINLERNISKAGYETWAECKNGIIRIYKIHQSKVKAKDYLNLTQEGMISSEAVKQVVQQVIFIFNPVELLKEPMMSAKKKKGLFT